MAILDFDPPSARHANAVQGMLDNPELTRVLELATTNGTVPLYADERMELRADRLLVRDVRTCDWHQVKLVLAHRPQLPIVVEPCAEQSRAEPARPAKPAEPAEEPQPRVASTQSLRTPPRRPARRNAHAIAVHLGDRVIALHGAGCIKFGTPNIF
jgi:hypothetical protein